MINLLNWLVISKAKHLNYRPTAPDASFNRNAVNLNSREGGIASHPNYFILHNS